MNTKLTYSQSPWSLDDLFKGFDDPAIEATYQKLEAQVAEFEKYRNTLTSDISEQKFMEMVKSLEAMEKLGYKIYGFAQLSFAADTQNQKALIALARIQQFAA
ncbi:MAG TPA: oligoendopeptidase F, partial [Anaerolineaceae bacterium]|nr:oligoendopeptidase F [Anaerolineaceae bacterium]